MPHSVKYDTATRGHDRRSVAPGVMFPRVASQLCRDERGQLDPSKSTQTGNAARQQSPMLKEWQDELDPRKLTINEALLFGHLTWYVGHEPPTRQDHLYDVNDRSARAEVRHAEGRLGGVATRLAGQRVG
ncbi:hypothetical protein N656DRAFT_800525 [Canariomyces notabilis]|uniref:Uncharacterized protein n=1 Tax=Canariomyces notabilis TaxID=2074819 RepID=A0AAN6QJX1_9PEZI|nr:hypothetical protein N656DRAFT_800525 [Canariomyces arenarius]